MAPRTRLRGGEYNKFLSNEDTSPNRRFALAARVFSSLFSKPENKRAHRFPVNAVFGIFLKYMPFHHGDTDTAEKQDDEQDSHNTKDVKIHKPRYKKPRPD